MAKLYQELKAAGLDIRYAIEICFANLQILPLPAAFDSASLAKGSALFTGAEIEQCFVDGLCRAFHVNREVGELDIGMAMMEIVPLANLMDEDIARLRHPLLIEKQRRTPPSFMANPLDSTI